MQHIAKMQSAYPPERLLTYNVKSGWEPLCKFLGKPIPSIPFPNVHDRVKLEGEMFVLWLLTWAWPVLLACPAVGCWFINRVRQRTQACKALKRNL